MAIGSRGIDASAERGFLSLGDALAASQEPQHRIDDHFSLRLDILGRFEIAQGILSGTREISGPALVNFLNRDTNQLATLIVVRETMGSGREDLVHGFAGKYHPSLLPPTLKLRAVPRR